MGSIVRMDPKPSWSCWYMSRPSPQPISRNRVFEIERREPPLRSLCRRWSLEKFLSKRLLGDVSPARAQPLENFKISRPTSSVNPKEWRIFFQYPSTQLCYMGIGGLNHQPCHITSLSYFLFRMATASRAQKLTRLSWATTSLSHQQTILSSDFPNLVDIRRRSTNLE